MKLGEINPFIRFASEFDYKSDGITVKVSDCRLFYILSGAGEIVVQNQHLAVSENTLIYFPAGSVYTIKSPAGFRLIALNFDLTQELGDTGKIFAPLPVDEKSDIKVISTEIEDSILNSFVFREDSEKFLSDLHLLIEEMSSERELRREIASCILKNILLKLHRDNTVSNSKSRRAVDTVTDYISKNYFTELTNKKLAALVGYHEFHLNRLFVKYTGTSIHQYIINKRLGEAKALMLSTELSLAEISEQVGFNNYSFFSSYFKKKYGISPAKFRNRSRFVSP